ncbi:predicted protein, partial [Nematostella vectensis]
FDKNCLEAHNEYRKRHGAKEMTWSASLAADAQKWADKLSQTDAFKHDYASINSKSQGENLAYFTPQKPNNTAIMDAFDAWYDESSKYDYANAKFSKETGHFTQLVWKATQKMGIGTAKNAKGDKEYVVARFSPAGNIKGQFADNVLPSIVNK